MLLGEFSRARDEISKKLFPGKKCSGKIGWRKSMRCLVQPKSLERHVKKIQKNLIVNFFSAYYQEEQNLKLLVLFAAVTMSLLETVLVVAKRRP